MTFTEFYKARGYPNTPPLYLQEYENTLPGAAERLIKMAELQGEHRRELEENVISGDIKQSKLGSIFAFIMGMSQ